MDLDDLWAYQMVQETPGWRRLPSYLPQVVPTILEQLPGPITFFVVGKDAEKEENQPLLQEIVRQGHELGNHTYSHEPWLHRMPETQVAEEIAKAQEAICAATGVTPRGFRSPGFSWHPNLPELLSSAGFAYDSTQFPTALGPLAKLAAGSSKLYSSFSSGFRTNRPHKIEQLLEIPVTTIPYLKTPFHMSYLHFLYGLSQGRAPLLEGSARLLPHCKGRPQLPPPPHRLLWR